MVVVLGTLKIFLTIFIIIKMTSKLVDVVTKFKAENDIDYVKHTKIWE